MFRKLSLIFLIATVIAVSALLIIAELELKERDYDTDISKSAGIFTESIELELIDPKIFEKQGRRVIVLRTDWGYVNILKKQNSSRQHNLQYIPVSRYFVSDFASIPFPFNKILSPFGRYAEPAILHDWLYAIGQPGKRKEADILFYKSMKEQDVGWFERRIFFGAVRMYSFLSFINNPYGRDNEWYGNFREPISGVILSKSCVIQKPKEYGKAVKVSNEFVTLEQYVERVNVLAEQLSVASSSGSKAEVVRLQLELSQLTETLRMFGEFYASSFPLRAAVERGSRNVFHAQWRNMLSSEECRRKLYEGYVSRFVNYSQFAKELGVTDPLTLENIEGVISEAIRRILISSATESADIYNDILAGGEYGEKRITTNYEIPPSLEQAAEQAAAAQH